MLLRLLPAWNENPAREEGGDKEYFRVSSRAIDALIRARNCLDKGTIKAALKRLDPQEEEQRAESSAPLGPPSMCSLLIEESLTTKEGSLRVIIKVLLSS